ncbi:MULTISPECIES: EAL domain-containing protein [unclassified Shewanella]|uniref:EAL domain-containing protein n=1 Tax=unclassified Shewanella TaxID=196818 RepID=UPI001E42781F|nr:MULTISPECIES: EAL domain-containing protein [unclassified Shewanella]
MSFMQEQLTTFNSVTSRLAESSISSLYGEIPVRIRIIKTWFSVVVLVLICSVPAFASGVVQRIFTASDGLINGTVWDISFDAHGFTWLATEEGLYRVSSTKIRRIDQVGLDSKLSDNLIHLVSPLSKRHLLVSSFYEIYLYDIYTNTFTAFGSNTLFPEFEGLGIISQVEDDYGNRILLTREGELLRFNYRRMSLERVNFLSSNQDYPWRAISAISDNRLLVATEGRIEVRDEVGERVAVLPWSESDGRIEQIFRDSNNRVWISSSKGFFELIQQDLSIRKVTQLPYYITHIAEDQKGFLWLATRSGLLKWLPDAPSGQLYGNEIKQKSNIDYIHDIAVDDTGLIWIGGSGDGVAVLADNPDFLLEQFSKAAPYQLPDEVIWSIYADKENVWFGTDAGLFLIDRQTKHPYVITPKNIDLNDSIYHIEPLDEQNILLSSTNGLSIVNKTTFHTQTFGDWMGGSGTLESKTVYSTYFDTLIQGRIWFATNRGLFFWDPGLAEPQYVSLSTDRSIVQLQIIKHVNRDSAQRLWLGGDRLLGYLDKQNNFHAVTIPQALGLDTISVKTMKEVEPGLFWIGFKDRGVVEYNSQTGDARSLTEEWKVSCDSVYFIEDVEQYRIIGCPRSIIRFDTMTDEIIVVAAEDGFISDELNEGAVFVSPEGLYVGTPDGAMLLDVTKFKNRIVKDTILLESMEVYFEDRTEVNLLPQEGHRILPGAQLVSFQLARNNYLNEKPLQLQYRLRRAEDKTGGSYIYLDGQSQLNISGLDAGTHVLEIISVQNEVWSAAPFSFSFEVEMYWWQTRWFKGLLLVVVLLLGLGIIFVRQRQVMTFRGMNSALTESENRLKQALRGSNSELWEWHLETDIFRLENVGGLLSKQETQVHLKLGEFPIHNEDKSNVLTAWKDMLDERTDRFEVEYRYLRSDKLWGWVRVLGRPVERNEFNGKIERVAGIYTDISEQRQLKDDVYLLAQAFENTSEAVLIYDRDELIQVTNKAAQDILGFNANTLIGRSFAEVLRGKESGTHIADLLQHGLSWTGECTVACANDQQCVVWLNVSSILNATGEATHYVVVFSDITDRKRTEADLRRLANYDVLTGLPNRSLFSSKLSHSIYQAEKEGGKLALLFLDLDRFKHVNDSYGHSMGDALLVEASNRLQAFITNDNVLCRFGGDEFVILLRSDTELDSINLLCEQLLASIQKPFDLYGREFYISTSIGVSLWPEDAKQPETLIKNADLAMYHAKDEGKGNFKYYSQERNAEALYHLRLETDLRKAIERDEFELHFQPQIDILQNDKLVGVEALLRWNHPQDGYVRTDIFIKVAEACGLIVDIDRWVMREACRHGARWAQILDEPLKVSVNISALHFRQPDFINGVEKSLAETGMPNRSLSLEITEGVLMKELEVAKQHLKELKSLGIDVAIDDFGTGYSSLAYLRHFEVNTLKIDRSFLIDIATNKADQAIASSIIELARNLKLDVVAEGVETHEQLEQVFSRGCYVIQGYYFAKPMSCTDLDTYMAIRPEVNLQSKADQLMAPSA